MVCIYLEQQMNYSFMNEYEFCQNWPTQWQKLSHHLTELANVKLVFELNNSLPLIDENIIVVIEEYEREKSKQAQFWDLGNFLTYSLAL